jgi:hypothetical protein
VFARSALGVRARALRAFGPERTESLLFACPKRSNQEKGHPGAAPLAGYVRAGRAFRQYIPVLSKRDRRPCRSPCGPDRPALTAAQGPRADQKRLRWDWCFARHRCCARWLRIVYGFWRCPLLCSLRFAPLCDLSLRDLHPCDAWALPALCALTVCAHGCALLFMGPHWEQ